MRLFQFFDIGEFGTHLIEVIHYNYHTAIEALNNQGFNYVVKNYLCNNDMGSPYISIDEIYICESMVEEISDVLT